MRILQAAGPSVAVLACFLALPTDAAAQGEQIKPRLRVWLNEFDGTFLGDGPTMSGTDLDMKDDLGLEDPDNTYWIDAMFAQGTGRTWVTLWEADVSGDATLTGPESLDDQTFGPGPVRGNLDIQYGRLNYENFLMGQRMLGMAVIVSFLSGFEYLSIDVKMEDAANSASKGLSFYRPSMGFRAEAWAGQWLTFEAHIVTFPKIKFDDIKARTFEWQVGAQLRLGRWSVDVGYRWTNFLAEEDKSGNEDIEVDLEVKGWFFGLSASF